MSPLVLTNLAVVLATKNIDPKILIPDSLREKGIIPKDWVTRDVLMAPGISQVSFDSGITFAAQPDRVQINDTSGIVPEKSVLVGISHKLIEEEVQKATAIGVNFHIAIEVEFPNKILLDRFINPKTLKKSDGQATGIEVKYTLSIEDHHLKLRFDQGVLKSEEEGEEKQLSTIGIHANFHHEATERQPEQLISLVNRIPEHWRKLKTILEALKL